MVRIITLMDNKASEHKALINEHGLSYLVQAENYRFLFDCGSGSAPMINAHRLGQELSGLDSVVISHSHYDHAAGYRDLTEQGKGSKLLYTGCGFFEAKFAFDGVKYTDLSAGFDKGFLLANNIEHREVKDITEIAKDIYLVAGFERKSDFENIPERFVKLTDSGFVKDDFSDEICVAIKSDGALVLLMGCSHPGILNMVSSVHERMGMPVKAIFGGTHLNEAQSSRIDKTISALRQMGVTTLGFSHCSGDNAETAARGCCDISGCHLSVGDNIFF